jgi:hypothetical protein
MYEEILDMIILYNISPELTCTCDEHHECQQCNEDRRNDFLLNQLESTL